MMRFFHWVWQRGIISTFLSGLFAALPIVITVAIIAWVGDLLRVWLLPTLERLGLPIFQRLGFSTFADEVVVPIIGLVLVCISIWSLGVLVKSRARRKIYKSFHSVIDHIPIVKPVYNTAEQLVAMLKTNEDETLKAMSVVFCRFGGPGGMGILALLAVPDVFHFDGRDYNIVYMPTSPIPMSGGIMLVPADSIKQVDMSVEQLMRIYLSMGIPLKRRRAGRVSKKQRLVIGDSNKMLTDCTASGSYRKSRDLWSRGTCFLISFYSGSPSKFI